MRILSIMTIDVSNAGKMPTHEEMTRMQAFIDELRAQGSLVDTGGVMDDMMELKVTRKGDKVSVTDGPFTEAKEVVGGFALMDVADRDEALALTNRFLEIVGDATCHVHEVSCA